MDSLRAPKIVKFYGSDEREHQFLAKTGEDLRLVWSKPPIRDTGCCCHPRTGVPCFRLGPCRTNGWSNCSV